MEPSSHTWWTIVALGIDSTILAVNGRGEGTTSSTAPRSWITARIFAQPVEADNCVSV